MCDIFDITEEKAMSLGTCKTCKQELSKIRHREKRQRINRVSLCCVTIIRNLL